MYAHAWCAEDGIEYNHFHHVGHVSHGPTHPRRIPAAGTCAATVLVGEQKEAAEIKMNRHVLANRICRESLLPFDLFSFEI